MSEPSKKPSNKPAPPVSTPSTPQPSAPLPSSAYTTPAKPKVKPQRDGQSDKLPLTPVAESEFESEVKDNDNPTVPIPPTSNVQSELNVQSGSELEMKREFDLAMIAMQNKLHATEQLLQEVQQQNAFLDYQARARFYPSSVHDAGTSATMPMSAFIKAVGTPEPFTGAYSCNPATWITSVRDYCRLTCVPTHLQAALAISWLRGSAREWYTAFPQDVKVQANDFEIFSTMLLSRYRPVDAARTARTKLEQLKQKQSVQKYNTDFIELIQDIHDMSFADQIHNYRRGLKIEVQKELITKEFDTLNDAMNTASQVDTLLFSLHRERGQRNGNGHYLNHNGFRNPNASAPMEVNNMNIDPVQTDSELGDVALNAVRFSTRFQKLTPEQRSQLMREGRCFKCRQPGHMAIACPTKSSSGTGMKPSIPISNTKKY